MRAAGFPLINTVVEPCEIVSGGPVHIAISETRAAGMPPIITLLEPGGISGPPVCGVLPVVIGQICISPILAAGFPMIN
jgi:hypothetical protein